MAFSSHNVLLPDGTYTLLHVPGGPSPVADRGMFLALKG